MQNLVAISQATTQIKIIAHKGSNALASKRSLKIMVRLKLVLRVFVVKNLNSWFMLGHLSR